MQKKPKRQEMNYVRSGRGLCQVVVDRVGFTHKSITAGELMKKIASPFHDDITLSRVGDFLMKRLLPMGIFKREENNQWYDARKFRIIIDIMIEEVKDGGNQ